MVLNIIFGFLTNYPPALAVTIFSVIVLVLINIFYKILINQNEAKQLKLRQKELSKQMRAEQKAGNTEKSSQLMKETMQENSRLMKMTMKPMIISMVIVILLLPWLHTSYGDIIADIKDDAGTVTINGVEHPFTVGRNDVTIESVQGYTGACDGQCVSVDGTAYEVAIDRGFFGGEEKLKLGPIVTVMPLPLPLFGSTVGWLGWYILCSIPFVIIIRKLMKIYV